MPTYEVTFERIGRNRAIPPVSIAACDALDLAMAISDYAAPHIRSQEYDVGIDEGMAGGHIIAGMHEVSTFTIATK